jgi:hypothetical protein
MWYYDTYFTWIVLAQRNLLRGHNNTISTELCTTRTIANTIGGGFSIMDHKRYVPHVPHYLVLEGHKVARTHERVNSNYRGGETAGGLGSVDNLRTTKSNPRISFFMTILTYFYTVAELPIHHHGAAAPA